MDQDSFRQLLHKTPRNQPSSGSTSTSIPKTSRTSKASSKTKAKAPGAAEPAFKPRKLKSADLKYRDRAAERRDGNGNDYAEVEAVLEDFEKRTANDDKDAVEQQRRYLGGDSDHSILVKGLDMALLEQNRARAVASTDDDDTLEQAFIEATSGPVNTVPKKRTREDIIRELKEKRQKGGGSRPPDEAEVVDTAKPVQSDDIDALAEAKKAGKFKPIGFKPIGERKETKGKKKRSKEGDKGDERKKKKRKEEKPAETEPDKEKEVSPPLPLPPPSAPEAEEPPPLDEDYDIFAGAGAYEGIDLGESDESDHEAGPSKLKSPEAVQDEGHSPPTALPPKNGWFADDEEPAASALVPAVPPADDADVPMAPANAEDEPDSEQLVRLQPLESSALPSIRDFLAMDQAAEAREKRKARKEKQKKKKKDADDDD
ncbi:RED-like protein N-terminal region-domain-containing protein [Hygrophoropsis aurantiaca]|uniref:RED-like protein N-terminal region-domain-containing protein n=1 Tax=Hygrophoropsis aurantiaca TaxID=72124 RepID=A0ACB8A245_9AGAM|nr:RED-like protein N-terminal region-domain-containing protein [Hygrophoropsis aurantiaca]